MRCWAALLSTPGWRSLYDLFGSGFMLLVMDGLGVDLDAARDETAATGTPLEVVPCDDPAVHALYQTRLALIRPDQHVAWRGDHWPDTGLLAMVVGRTMAAMATS